MRRRAETSRRKVLLSPRSCVLLCDRLAKNQGQTADSRTATPEWTKPRGKSRSAQHNVIKVFHLFFQDVQLNIYAFSQITKQNLGSIVQQMDQSKWDLSPYQYLNNDRSVKHLPSKRFGLPIKNRKIPVKPLMCFYPEPSDLHMLLQTLPLFMYL